MGAGGPRRGVGPPDGGWGWAVLGACFAVTGFAYGFPKAVSVFFRALMRDFGAGYSDMAWVSSIMLAMLYGTGQCSLPRPRTGDGDEGPGDTQPPENPSGPLTEDTETFSFLSEGWHQREGRRGKEGGSSPKWSLHPGGRPSKLDQWQGPHHSCQKTNTCLSYRWGN